MHQLPELFNELESTIPYCEKQQLSVSRAPVGWHIQHSLMVALQIIQAAESSNPLNYRWKFSLNRLFVFTLNKIPRGKGRAPQSVMPKGDFNEAELIKDFQLLKNRLTVLDNLQPNNFFDHPYFGALNLKATIKMIELHTRHHIDIINDIIKR
jgi:hypothetical protein